MKEICTDEFSVKMVTFCVEVGRRVVIGGGVDCGRYGIGGSGRRGGFEEEGLQERVEWGVTPQAKA